ncbi:nucleoporin 35 [Oratosquilla oratoria]|uniref:nucleoporin 35 n=1 Tax=Oratosquilla oratoria TaxID=337810 RepID=UPI003F76265A
MEPMTLGSPVGSPGVVGLGQTTNNSGSTFLPSYLMGDVGSQATAGRVGGTSPNKTARQFSSSTTVSTPGSPQPVKDPFFSNRLGADKPGGPPTQALFACRGPQTPGSPLPRLGAMSVERLLGPPGGTSSTPVAYGSPYAQQTSLHASPALGIMSPARDLSSAIICPDTLQGDTGIEALEDTWVTVFGFPAPAAAYILTQFTQLGTILSHKNPGCGNWMHLRYQTKLQAKKALSKNGKIFGGNIMVGVVPCTDKTVTEEKENVPVGLATPTTPTVKPNMRPLTQAYQTAHAELEVAPKPNTPKKNEGFVSKAMQHILGL